MTTEAHGHVTSVAREVDGDELTAAAASGATVLTVRDVADFDEDGGTVRLDDGADTLRDYVSITDQPPTITLASPIPTSLAVGTRVDVWDTDENAPTVVYRATVVDDVTGEALDADVSHELIDKLESSVRARFSESVVCRQDEAGRWSVVDVLGRIPVTDGTFIDPETVPVSPSLQDQVDAALAAAGSAASAASDAAAQADAALTAANAAQADADAAQTSADGKNRIFYSTSTPGSTPNIAGDTWFRRDGSGVIIAQWEGAGGTTWTPRTLDNAVIATLDAGKLTAGSAFTNALTVRNTMTLGTSSNDGIIESFNFAGSTQAVRISKLGLNAKGGTLTGALIQTDTGSTTGIKMTSTGFTAYGGGVPTLAIDAVTGAIVMKGTLTSGSVITGATFQTATSGQRVVIDGTNAASFYSGSPYESEPGLVQGAVIPGSLQTLLRSPVVNNGVRNFAGILLNVNIDGSGNPLSEEVSFLADLVRLPVAQVTGNLTVNSGNIIGTMGTGSVGTGTFRDSVRSDIAAGGGTANWANLSISSPFTAVSGQTPEYRKDAAGNVHLRGAVNRVTASSGALVATLPAGFRPTASVFGIVRTNAVATTAQIAINTAGQIAVSWSGTPSALGIEIVFSTL